MVSTMYYNIYKVNSRKGDDNVITETGREMLRFQEQLAKDYGYQPIGYNLFLGDVRQKYLDALPEWRKVDGDPEIPLFTDKGTQISTGYKRIVIGDYGAFIEMSQEQMVMDNIQICDGQEYRIEDARLVKRPQNTYHIVFNFC